MRDIGKNIRQLRQRKNMTQDELAERLFVTRQTVSNYETGKSRPDVEMLARIAEMLETDIHSLLYGPTENTDRRRMLVRLCISLAVLAVAWIGFIHAVDLGRELAQWRFDSRLNLCCVFFGIPIMAFLVGWTAMQALGTVVRLSPIQAPWNKRLRWIVAGVSAGYLLTILPFALEYVFGIAAPSALRGFLYDALYWAAMWLTGLIHNTHLRPSILLFGLLGCALWLGIPQKAKQQKKKRDA